MQLIALNDVGARHGGFTQSRLGFGLAICWRLARLFGDVLRTSRQKHDHQNYFDHGEIMKLGVVSSVVFEIKAMFSLENIGINNHNVHFVAACLKPLISLGFIL